jgi:hypothetical protein
MAAPEFVPLRPGRGDKVYESPPRRLGSWEAVRPGELVGNAQPEGEALGNQGPDQGYALWLAERFRGHLTLAPDESEDDVLAGCVAIAMRRASLFGRAPVVHDLRLAFEPFGFLDDTLDEEKVAFRRPLFIEVANPHNYFAARHLAAMVPESTLRSTPEAVRSMGARWRTLLGV